MEGGNGLTYCDARVFRTPLHPYTLLPPIPITPLSISTYTTVIYPKSLTPL